MTCKQLHDLILVHHPFLGETEFLVYYNMAARNFAYDTKLLKRKSNDITSVASQLEYNDTEITTPLWSDIITIHEITFNSKTISRIIGQKPRIGVYDNLKTDEHYWWVENDKLNIVKGGSPTTYNTASKTFNLYVTYHPTDLTAATLLTASPPFDARFHDALMYHIIAQVYIDPRNFDIEKSAFFDMKYNMILKAAKKESRMKKYNAGYIVHSTF
jgi:hypothetical protein